MKKALGITGIKNRTSYSKRILRKFVNTHLLNMAWKEKANKKGDRFLADYETIGCCSALVPINGTVDLLFDARYPESISRISIPIQSAFLVTCTHEATNDYKVTWASSLS